MGPFFMPTLLVGINFKRVYNLNICNIDDMASFKE